MLVPRAAAVAYDLRPVDNLSVRKFFLMTQLIAFAAMAASLFLPHPARAQTGFLDNFNGPAGALPNQSMWSFDTGGNWGNGQELQAYTYSPRNASLDGQGHLVITARNETYTGTDGITRQYTSARLQTFSKFDFTYGRIAARIKVPAGAGLWPAFWALGDDAYSAGDWPASGEIDVMELLGAQPQVAYGTIHGPLGTSADGYQVQGDYRSSASLADGYHVYSAVWGPSSISFQVDGHTYRTITTADLPAGASWPFRHPFFLVLNLAVGGTWGGAPTASTPWPARMLVDSVSVSPLAASARSRGRRHRLRTPGSRRGGRAA